MTEPGRGPELPDGSADWPRSLLGGFLIFLLIGGIGLVAAVTALAVAAPGMSLARAVRVGALYLGPFHHVALVFEGDLAVDVARLPGANLPADGSATLELGVALLAVTALAVWLLFRAGRRSAYGDRLGVRALTGSRVALGYAPPVLLVALLVRFEEPVELGTFVTGGVRISLSAWQALVFPFAMAALAGATGGMWSWASSAAEPSAARTRAVLGGGWRMFLLALALSYVGLFLAGIAQPDEPVALATPSTARYVDTVFERPGEGSVILAHHLALSPNEAIWTFVPAAGACDVVRGSERSDVLCYGRFPSLDMSSGEVAFGDAPPGYLAFLLVPAIATIVGGRWAGSVSERSGAAGAAVGAAAGAAFAVVMLGAIVASSITLSYGAHPDAVGRGGHLWIGPDPVAGTLAALAWGVIGGALGGATSGFRRSRGARRPAG
ncbi:MAG TPA: hypothetical protein VFM40_07695 [Actinomycetota bacterium]|nr:hypothetical protein [Actinomycetota bacterium]